MAAGMDVHCLACQPEGTEGGREDNRLVWCVRCVKRIMYSLPLANVLALSQGSNTQSFQVVLCINQTFTLFVKGTHQILLSPPSATSPPLQNLVETV